MSDQNQQQTNEPAAPQGQPVEANSFEELIFGDNQPSQGEPMQQQYAAPEQSFDPSSPQYLGQFSENQQNSGDEQQGNQQTQQDGQSNDGEQRLINGQPIENIEERYRYFQSKYDQLKNQVEPFVPLIEDIQKNPEMLAKLYGQDGQGAQDTQEATLPEPPAEPERPRNFSRDVAITDPASESAQYLDELDEWNRKMQKYNMEATQRLNQKIEQTDKQRREEERKRQEAIRQQQAEQAQLSKVQQYVQQQHGLDEDAARDFVQKFSDPSSLNIDTMTKLYKLENGMDVSGPQHQQQFQPSQQFQQTQRAQQAAQPITAQSGRNQARREPVDQNQAFTDSLVSTWKANNPLDALMGS